MQPRNQKNLRTLSVELATRLGLVANTNQTYNIQAPLLHSFIQDSAEQLHEQFGSQLLREQEYPLSLTAGNARYPLPVEADPYRINDVSVLINGQYVSLQQGIPVRLRNSNIDNTFPTRWQLLYDDASEQNPNNIPFDRWIVDDTPYGWEQYGTHDATNYVSAYNVTTDIHQPRGIVFTGDDSQQAGVKISSTLTISTDYIVEYEYSDATTGTIEFSLGGTSFTIMPAASAGTRKRVKVTSEASGTDLVLRPTDGTSINCTLVYFSVTESSEKPRFQIEFWPTPDTTYTARLDFYRQLGAFTQDTDICPIAPSRLVWLLALVNAKAHYDQPDAQGYVAQMEQMLRQVRKRQHGNMRYTSATPYDHDPYKIDYAESQATFTPFSALIDTDGDYFVDA